jgi:hypothetical protein
LELGKKTSAVTGLGGHNYKKDGRDDVTGGACPVPHLSVTPLLIILHSVILCSPPWLWIRPALFSWFFCGEFRAKEAVQHEETERLPLRRHPFDGSEW